METVQSKILEEDSCSTMPQGRGIHHHHHEIGK